MNDKNFNFWTDHSMKYLEMALSKERLGRLEHPDGYGKKTGKCGDTIEMFLTVQNENILSVLYVANGCLNTHACTNTVALMAEGKTVDQAWNITPENVIGYLETLPQDERHCAELAVGTLYLALSNYQYKK